MQNLCKNNPHQYTQLNDEWNVIDDNPLDDEHRGEFKLLIHQNVLRAVVRIIQVGFNDDATCIA